MWKTEIRVKTQATKESIWSRWKSIERWKDWDNSIEFAYLNDSFHEGASGLIKPKGGPKTKFTITKIVENEIFVNQSRLPFCTIDFIHEIIQDKNDIVVVHKIEMRGVLSFLFSKIMGADMARELPNSVNMLIELVENE